MPNTALFARAQAELFGRRGHRALSKALGISERSVWNYVTGERAVPAELWDRLAVLATERAGGLIALTVEIRRNQ